MFSNPSAPLFKNLLPLFIQRFHQNLPNPRNHYIVSPILLFNGVLLLVLDREGHRRDPDRSHRQQLLCACCSARSHCLDDLPVRDEARDGEVKLPATRSAEASHELHIPGKDVRVPPEGIERHSLGPFQEAQRRGRLDAQELSNPPIAFLCSFFPD